MENWNKNEWQGRRKEQYESSAKIVSISFLLILVTSIASIIYLLF